MPRSSDERMERIIGALLRAGVTLSTILVLAGTALYLSRHAADHPDFRLFHGEPRQLRGITGIAREAFALRGPGLIQLGLLVLIATPLARVAFSVFAFAA